MAYFNFINQFQLISNSNAMPQTKNDSLSSPQNKKSLFNRRSSPLKKDMLVISQAASDELDKTKETTSATILDCLEIPCEINQQSGTQSNSCSKEKEGSIFFDPKTTAPEVKKKSPSSVGKIIENERNTLSPRIDNWPGPFQISVKKTPADNGEEEIHEKRKYDSVLPTGTTLLGSITDYQKQIKEQAESKFHKLSILSK